MSRTLTKVMVICALVVVLPLMIVGTAFAAYVSVDNVAIVETVFVDDLKAKSDEVYAKIKYNNTVKDKFEIKNGQTKNITVGAEYSTQAYKFLGWYEGTKDAYLNDSNATFIDDERISGNLLTVDMSVNKNFVAVYEVVKYSVSEWEYATQPEGLIVNEAPADAKEVYVYGEILPSFTAENERYDFAWQVKGEDTRFTTATIPTTQTNNTLSLVGNWQKKEKISAKLSYEANDLKDGIIVNENATFNASEYAELENWFNLQTKYSFWKVEGVRFNGNVYTSAKDLAEYVYNNVDVSGDFELVVAKKVNEVSFENVITFKAQAENIPTSDYAYDIYLGEETVEHSVRISNPISSTTKLKDLLMIHDKATYTEINGQKHEAVFKGITLTIKNSLVFNMDAQSNNFNLDFTVNDFLESCIEAHPELEINSLGDLLEIVDLEVEFYAGKIIA